MYTLFTLAHDILISVWNDWFMTPCCNGCGVGLPPFPVSAAYTLLISLTMSSSSRFYDEVLYILLLYRFALNMFPSWTRWVELKHLRAGHRRKGSTRIKRRNKKTCPWLIRSRLSQRCMSRLTSRTFKTLKHDSGDIKALWSQSTYRYVSFFSYWLLGKFLLNVSCCGGRRNKWEIRLTQYQV